MTAHRKAVSLLGQGRGPSSDLLMKDGKSDPVAGVLDIQQSLILLLGTHPGERKMGPNYGVDLTPLRFESLTFEAQTHVTEKIERAILEFEPRIILDSVQFESHDQEDTLAIVLYYTIQSTNSTTNLVYPIYLAEGTEP